MKLTGAQILCESLLLEGVDVVFGIPGGAILSDTNKQLQWQRTVMHDLPEK